jgi:hypothetical protein
VGKINMSSYLMSPSVPEYSCNPDELSLPLKYLLAIQFNLSILILAHPKWSILLMAFFTTDATSICSDLLTCPFFLFHINMMTVYVFNY